MSIEDRRIINQKQQLQNKKPIHQQRYTLDSVDPTTGKHKAVGADGSVIYGDKKYNSQGEIKNTTVSPDGNVSFSGQTSDKVVRPNNEVGYIRGQIFGTPTVETRIERHIKYVYLTGGSNPNRTALCVAGYKEGWTVQIDEWSNSEYILLTAVIDNLGGSDFIVSYVLGRQPSPRTYGGIVSYNHTFKVARQSGNTFSREIPDKYYPGLVITQSRGPNVPGFASPGYGNWLCGAIIDLSTVAENPGFISGDTVFRLSDLGLNPSIPTEFDLLPYNRIYTSPPYGALINITPGYMYLNPETSYNAYYIATQEGTVNGSTEAIYRVKTDWPICVRYNARSGKSLSWLDFRNDLITRSGAFSGDYENDYRSWVLKPSRGSTPATIKFSRPDYNPPYSYYFPPASNYSASVNCTTGSDIATITSGPAPVVGTMMTGGSFGYGAIVLESSGNTIRLSEKSSDTTDLPDNPTSIEWGFLSSYSGYNNGGYLRSTVIVDLLSNGVSYFDYGHLTRSKPGGSDFFLPQLKTEKIDCYVSLFGDDLLPTGYKKVVVYPPTIVNPHANPSIAPRDFYIYHASYG